MGLITIGIETAEREKTEILVCDIMGNPVYMSSFFESDGNYSRHEVTPDKELARGMYLSSYAPAGKA